MKNNPSKKNQAKLLEYLKKVQSEQVINDITNKILVSNSKNEKNRKSGI